MNVANGVPTKANFTPASNSKRAFKKEVFYVFCYLIMAHNTMVVGLHIEIPALEHCFCVEFVNQRKPGEELQTRGALGFPDPGKRSKHSLRSKSIGIKFPGGILSHPEIFGFQDLIKIKNKTTIFS